MTDTVFRIPVIETPRLRLRAAEARDFDAYAAFRASPRAVHLGGPDDRATAWGIFCGLIGQWPLRGYGRWIIADRETDEALGTTGVYHPEGWPGPEISWSVFESAEGRGIAYEAATAARAHAHEAAGLDRLISCVRPDNTRSRRLAERMGCVYEGTFPHETLGDLHIWRHPSRADLAATGAAPMETAP